VLYATLHAVATPPWGGLTPALGGRKAFDCFAFQHVDFAGFGWRCSSVGFMRRCFFGQVSVARSHITTLRWPASETVIGVVSFPTTDAVASETSGESFSGARPGFPASAFGKSAKVSLSPASFAPNKSFKPTPHRGVNSVLCATLHAVATPPWGGLTPALGRTSSD
jgi:hypothetical protein